MMFCMVQLCSVQNWLAVFLGSFKKRQGLKRFLTLYDFVESEINFRRLKWGIMPVIKTVKVKTDDGFAIINESDFDEKTMKLFDGKEKEKAAPKKRKTKG